MEFDQFTMLVLVRPANAPDLDEAELDAIQDAHLAHLAALHDAGQLVAAGPVRGEPDEPVRGFCIFATDAETAAGLMADDPAVRAGRLDAQAKTWLVPKGAVHFTPTRFPRSAAEATG